MIAGAPVEARRLRRRQRVASRSASATQAVYQHQVNNEHQQARSRSGSGRVGQRRRGRRARGEEQATTTRSGRLHDLPVTQEEARANGHPGLSLTSFAARCIGAETPPCAVSSSVLSCSPEPCADHSCSCGDRGALVTTYWNID